MFHTHLHLCPVAVPGATRRK